MPVTWYPVQRNKVAPNLICVVRPKCLSVIKSPKIERIPVVEIFVRLLNGTRDGAWYDIKGLTPEHERNQSKNQNQTSNKNQSQSNSHQELSWRSDDNVLHYYCSELTVCSPNTAPFPTKTRAYKNALCETQTIQKDAPKLPITTNYPLSIQITY